MIRYFLILLTLAATLLADGEPRTVKGTLSEVSGKSATVPVGPVPVGVSGIVVHYYDQTHAAILATAVVTASTEGHTTLGLQHYDGLPQPNLPDVKTPPKAGDVVVLGYLYDRVLPIVPNQKSLDYAKEAFPKLHIIHPDLVAVELAKAKEPLPNREILRKTCDKFNLGIVMIMFSDGTDFLDCISWKKVGHSDVAAVDVKDFKQPFFNRFESIPTAFYDFGDYHIADYDKFYRRLEREK
jgi:hypothetical protein